LKTVKRVVLDVVVGIGRLHVCNACESRFTQLLRTRQLGLGLKYFRLGTLYGRICLRNLSFKLGNPRQLKFGVKRFQRNDLVP